MEVLKAKPPVIKMYEKRTRTGSDAVMIARIPSNSRENKSRKTKKSGLTEETKNLH